MGGIGHRELFPNYVDGHALEAASKLSKKSFNCSGRKSLLASSTLSVLSMGGSKSVTDSK